MGPEDLDSVASGLSGLAEREWRCLDKMSSLKPAYELALHSMRGKGTKICRCASHVKPHLHRPCLVDLQAKRAAIGGALAILGLDLAKGPPPAEEGGQPFFIGGAELAVGTSYDVVHSPSQDVAPRDTARKLEESLLANAARDPVPQPAIASGED